MRGKGKGKGKGQGTRDKGQGTRADKGQSTRDEEKGTRAREKGKEQGTVRGWGRYGAAPFRSSLLIKSLSTREMNPVGEGPGFHMLQREPGVTWCLFTA